MPNVCRIQNYDYFVCLLGQWWLTHTCARGAAATERYLTQNRKKESHTRIRRTCSVKTCPFELVASKTSKSVVGFTIKEKFCNFTHTCVASRPEVCMKSANDINIKLAVLGCGDARKAAKACKPGGTVYDAYSRQGYALNCNPASLKRIMVRVVNRLFRVDKEGVDEALGEINDWVTKFNERQSNGLATLRTKPSDIPGGHDMFDSVTIVFRAADVATRKCGPRVYFIDAAYLAYERKDLRLGILEGTTSSNKIVPVAIHLGWGETTEFYCDMIEGIQAYSENGDDGEDTLWRHLDDKKTCFLLEGTISTTAVSPHPQVAILLQIAAKDVS